MKVTFWGVRGSIPAPGRNTVQFGGNTSCVQLESGGDLFILDAGTGIRELGQHLMASGRPVTGSILLSHPHWDHIQGFPFFGPLLAAGSAFTVFGAQEHTQRLNETLGGQMQHRYFPVKMGDLAADMRFHELREETLQIGGTLVRTHYLNHTSLALAYRFEAGGRTAVYATDHEPFAQQPHAWESRSSRKFLHRRDAELAEFCRGADLLIMDAQYTAHEYPGRIGWGHGTPDYALEIAISAGVGSLVLFHHDPTRIDTAVSVLEQLAQQRAHEDGAGLSVSCAAEGITLTLEDGDPAGVTAPERRLPEFIPRVRIAVVAPSESLTSLFHDALAGSHYELLMVEEIDEAELQRLNDFQPHLVVLAEAPAAGARRVIGQEARQAIPVLAVVGSGDYEGAQQAFELGVSDVLIEPFGTTHLRSRVDSWLMRAGVAVDRRLRGPRRQAAEASV